MNPYVIITGAYGGLGKALAHTYANEGYGLVLLGRKKDKLEALKKELPDSANVYLMQADIRDFESSLNAYRLIQKEKLHIKVLINNAAITYIKQFDEDYDLEQFKDVINTNLIGQVNITWLFINDLLANRGSLINISSVLGFAPLIGRSAYAASKFGLEGFSQVIRAETEGKMHVMMVYPTFFSSSIRNEVKGDKTINEILSPDDVAQMVYNAHIVKKEKLYIGKSAKLSYYINKFSPKMYVHLMRKKAGSID